MNTIIVSTITEIDIKKHQLRILKSNKYLFPNEIIGNPKTYELNFQFKGVIYTCCYRIGSNDGRSRSGFIKLTPELFLALDLEPLKHIRITKTEKIYELDIS